MWKILDDCIYKKTTQNIRTVGHIVTPDQWGAFPWLPSPFPVVATEVIQELTGPSTREQWMYWKSRSPQEVDRLSTIRELDKLLNSENVRPPGRSNI